MTSAVDISVASTIIILGYVELVARPKDNTFINEVNRRKDDCLSATSEKNHHLVLDIGYDRHSFFS